MRYSITTVARSLIPSIGGRPLVREPYRVATLTAARAWVSMMAPTWRNPETLLASEAGFTAFVLDADGAPALTLEYPRDPDAEPIEFDRGELREMNAAPTALMTMHTTTEGETTR